MKKIDFATANNKLKVQNVALLTGTEVGESVSEINNQWDDFWGVVQALSYQGFDVGKVRQAAISRLGLAQSVQLAFAVSENGTSRKKINNLMIVTTDSAGQQTSVPISSLPLKSEKSQSALEVIDLTPGRVFAAFPLEVSLARYRNNSPAQTNLSIPAWLQHLHGAACAIQETKRQIMILFMKEMNEKLNSGKTKDIVPFRPEIVIAQFNSEAIAISDKVIENLRAIPDSSSWIDFSRIKTLSEKHSFRVPQPTKRTPTVSGKAE